MVGRVAATMLVLAAVAAPSAHGATRLDADSTARFRLRLDRRVPARVVLTQADGATPLARSRTLRVGARR